MESAKLFVCPEGGIAHGYSPEPFTCDDGHDEPVEAVEQHFVRADRLAALESQLHRVKRISQEVENRAKRAERERDEAKARLAENGREGEG